MRTTTSYIMLAVALVVLAGCRARTGVDPRAAGDTLRLGEARRLTLVSHEGYTVATLANPWKEGQTLHTYVLVPADSSLPAHLPKGTVVRTPLRRAAVFTTVHCALLMELGRQDAICGVADLKYINLPWIQQQCRTGHMADYGEGMSPVVEKIIDTQPDALLLSPFENSGGYGKLEELGIPIIECAEYMEASPLGRAEWMRFYGLLFGAEKEADSLFARVKTHYEALSAAALQTRERPTVMMDKQTGSVWYVPGGHSTLGQMLHDAGAAYPWQADESSGSLSLSFESVLEKCGESDVWLLRYDGQPLTLSRLKSEHQGYGEFRAVKTGAVYACHVNTSHFYEETPFRPDLLLQDLVSIFHPGLAQGGRFYQKLADR